MRNSFLKGLLDGLTLRPLWKILAKADIDAAILVEREACAKLCESMSNRPHYERVAHLLRNRTSRPKSVSSLEN